eukprot:CAMPEP_0181315042 /NCGR_PEP_ID=MMETSP1101-20121128/15151_1 /TAXON_ID=46948 /ORGANISM="Rhodomonas abbreviata, Strain Caron Lab Isolate" /LENGTH=364 /DNA_ID=CAMNT_0023422197 /DNA_START=157 /DNA_END=1251 /DNA_ORIENTATION=-
MSAGDPNRKRTLEGEEILLADPQKRQQVAQGIADASNMTIKLLVANKLAGGVIGKAGATINSIKEASGARVKVSSSTETFPGTNDRVVLIQGSINAVLTASRLVVAELFREPAPQAEGSEFQAPEAAGDQTCTLTVVIPAPACGLIIGKGGERINALREQTQAKIQLQSKDRIIQGLNERTVMIQGNLLNAQMAVEKVILVLYEDGNIHYENLSTNYGGFSSIGKSGQMAGMGGMGGAQGLSLMQQAQLGGLTGLPMGYDYGAAFGLPPAAPPAMAPSQMDAGAGQVQMKLAIPELTVGLLVGKGGCIIKELMNLSGAQIKVSQKGDVVPGSTNRIVTITGNPVASNYAHMLVLQKVPTATTTQ